MKTDTPAAGDSRPSTALATPLRHDGESPPPDRRYAALRRMSMDVTTRPDGSVQVQWPAQEVTLHKGPAERDAPVSRMVPNVVDWLAVWAHDRPRALMLCDTDSDGTATRLDYAQAWARVRAIAHALVALKPPGRATAPIVAVLTGNSIPQALLTFAAMYAGWVVAPVSPAYMTTGGRPERLVQLLATLQPDLVYCESAESAGRILDTLGIALPSRVDRSHVARWSTLPQQDIDEVALAHAHAAAQGEAVAKIMFTSGSTGIPKGVPTTHAMLAAAQGTSASNLSRPPQAPQVYLEWLPWHHVIGGNVSLNRLLRFGGTLHIDRGRPAPGRFGVTLDNLRRVSPTFYFNVPLGYMMLAAALEEDDALAASFFRRLEYMSFGGASISPELVARLHALAVRHVGYALPITSAYGATETSGPALSTAWNMESGGVLGLPAPGIVAKLEPFEGRYELHLAGANIAQRYTNGTPIAHDAEGFMRTGDAVRWLDPGNPLLGLAFAGRISEEFKLLSGTWVNVGTLRQSVVEVLSPLVNDAVLTGHDRAFVGALLFINAHAVRAQFPEAAAFTRQELVRHPPLLQAVAERLARLRGGSSMRVLRAMLQHEDAVAEAFEITDKGYISQRAVLQRRATQVEALYVASPDDGVIQVPMQQIPGGSPTLS